MLFELSWRVTPGWFPKVDYKVLIESVHDYVWEEGDDE